MRELNEESVPALKSVDSSQLTAVYEAPGHSIDSTAGRTRDRFQGIKYILQRYKNRVRMFGVATLATVSLSQGETAVADSDPGIGRNTPTLLGAIALPNLAESSVSATTNLTLEAQQCADVALARPTITRKPVLYHAGIRLQQILQLGLLYPALPENCEPEYLRRVGGVEQIKKDGRWVNTMYGVGSASGNHEQRSSGAIGPSHATPAWVYNECINGRFEKSRIVLSADLRSGESGSRTVVAEQQYILPVKVQGNCRAAVRSRERYEEAS